MEIVKPTEENIEKEPTVDEMIAEGIANIKLLRQFVLIKQTMVAKAGLIIRDAARSEKDQFDYTWTVISKSSKCQEDAIEIGDHPVLSTYAQIQNIKIIYKDSKGMTSLVTVHENDIVMIDNNPLPSK